MIVRKHKLLRSSALVVACLATVALSACETPGKVQEATKFDVTQAEPDDIRAALERDGRVVLSGGVVFETDSATLSPQGSAATERLAAALQQDPNIKLAIVGHTDDTGAFAYNLQLSRQRAEAMARALVRDHGIAEDRLAAVGVGPLAPVVSNETPEGRAENRRVEVVLVN